MSKTFAVASLSSFLILVVIDFLWLSNAVNFLYRPKLGDLIADKPVIWAAVSWVWVGAVAVDIVLSFRERIALGRGT